MFLKELVLRLKRTLWGQFLREIFPLKKKPKSSTNMGAITGILLTAFWAVLFGGAYFPQRWDL
jgi:hypothetical protein